MNTKNNTIDIDWDKLKNILLVLSLVISIFAVLINFLTIPDSVTKFWNAMKDNLTTENVQFWINIGNILVSTYFLIVFMMPSKISGKYNIKWGDKDFDFCELAEHTTNRTTKTPTDESKIILQGYEKRVSILVIQYLWCIRFFAISLIFVYLSIISSSYNPISSTEGNRYISNFALANNFLNFSGGIIVFLAFWVLYSDTLNEHDKDNRFWLIPALITVLYLFGLICISWLYEEKALANRFLNRADLIAGLVNGLAMFLLFGRYVSLEISLSKTELFKAAFKDLFKRVIIFKNDEFYIKMVSFAIIFLLPIYALAQPQFGALEIPLYSDPKVFQTVVYGICLIGKICFFHLTYLIVNKRLLHLYLYGLSSNVGNFKMLEKCLIAVTK